jgi:hypothetical protein
MTIATLAAAPTDTTHMRTFLSIGCFLAWFSYALARNSVLPLFAAALGAGPVGIVLTVGISTVTGFLVSSLGYGPAFAIVATLLCASIPLFLNTMQKEPQTANLFNPNPNHQYPLGDHYASLRKTP